MILSSRLWKADGSGSRPSPVMDFSIGSAELSSYAITDLPTYSGHIGSNTGMIKS
jgi:hypothetical protein